MSPWKTNRSRYNYAWPYARLSANDFQCLGLHEACEADKIAFIFGNTYEFSKR